MTDWSKKNLFPLKDLEALYLIDPAQNTSTFVPDFSGKDRHLTVSAGNEPVLTQSTLRDEPGYYFNGSRDPLSYSGSVTAKHVFMLVSFDRAAFTHYEGLLSGISSGNVLTSHDAGTRFFEFGPTGYSYRKADVPYLTSNMQAPMNGSFALVEYTTPGAGIVLDGIRIGQQLADAARKLKGWWMGGGIYSAEQNNAIRLRWNMYAAMRFHLWPMVDGGLNVFPFPANKASSRDADVEHYLSEPYDGDLKALVRGSQIGTNSWPFTMRLQEELEAAEEFHRQHRPVTQFVIKDHRYVPAREIRSRFASSFREQGSDVTFRFNYSFDTVEVTTTGLTERYLP